ncbi:amidohydrolase [Vicingus serpentipes]|uniref:Amidohydrolase n=1 Tax=Vicingus serpentipes TaxID=1926625 RepID=A0A5C6RY74_9FLAO|nr:amidohydrolase [Vicingus serpentipes]TXB67017.1 amidohydrolase [Vicingus serpentipes]
MKSFVNKSFILIAIVLLFGCNPTEKIDLIVHNAKVYTVNDNFDVTDAFAINNGKIIAVGPENEIKNKYLAKEYLDAKKRPVYPGFIDAHCHFVGYAKSLQQVNLVGTTSFNEVLEKVVEFSNSNSTKWITGRGWDQNDWEIKEYPTKQQLDSLFPDQPIFLRRIDGHAALVNQKALDIANINTSTQIDGGVIEKTNGKLTGILIDNAVGLIKDIIPDFNNQELSKALIKAEQDLFKVGLTTVDDAGLNRTQIETIESLQNDSLLKIKVYAMVSAKAELFDYYLKKGPYKTERLNVSSFKFYADGALGSRGACLLEPYSDIIEQQHYGLLIEQQSFYENYAQQLYDKGFQMNTHCIGDSANRMIMNIYKNVLKTTNDKRWRIEHAQVINPADFKTFAEYTIIPSVQPTHATSDMYWAKDRLGEIRLKTAYAYKQLLQQNGLIALGTDFPIEGINPINTFYAGVVRKDAKEFPKDGFQTENALTREEALKGMTIWAAIANFEENEKGSIEVGKSADFVLLDNDIITTKENTILNTKVLTTYISGEKVFSTIK